MGDDLQQKFAINYFIIKLSYVLRRLSLWFSRSRSKNLQKLFLNMLLFSFILGLIFFPLFQIHATGRQEEEDGKTAVCDKRDRAITCGFCRDLHLTPRFSGPLQKDLFKGK